MAHGRYRAAVRPQFATTYLANLVIGGIEDSVQFSASILDREAPVDTGTIRIAVFVEYMVTAASGQSHQEHATSDSRALNTLSSISAMLSQLPCLGV